MHDGDKAGASAIGRLVRKGGSGGIVNSFPEGQALEKKLNAQAKHFWLFAVTAKDTKTLLGLPTKIRIFQ